MLSVSKSELRVGGVMQTERASELEDPLSWSGLAAGKHCDPRQVV